MGKETPPLKSLSDAIEARGRALQYEFEKNIQDFILNLIRSQYHDLEIRQIPDMKISLPNDYCSGVRINYMTEKYGNPDTVKLAFQALVTKRFEETLKGISWAFQNGGQQ